MESASADGHSATHEEPILKADPFVQLVLVDLQALDAQLTRLEHQMKTLPEHMELEELTIRQAELNAARVRAATAVSDLEIEQRKADADVEQVKTRRVRDQQRLDAGQVTNPKDLTNLQHEVITLDRRIAALEDTELEIMESLEAAQAELARIDAEVAQLHSQAAELTDRRDRALGDSGSQVGELRAEREQTAARLPEPLLALYDTVRSQQGTGAAALHQRRCEGCRLELNAADLREIASAPADDVLRCPECNRILVRTPDSGI